MHFLFFILFFQLEEICNLIPFIEDFFQIVNKSGRGNKHSDVRL